MMQANFSKRAYVPQILVFTRLLVTVVAALSVTMSAVPANAQYWTSCTGGICYNAGNVGIGTTNPGSFKLAVEGTIGARDVMVTNTNPWPDYVFRPGYRLRPLSEVSAYIQKHRHLPDIPTETEAKEKGVSLGDMQAKLLAKVEELTLHMIREHERNNRLEAQNRELRQQIHEVQSELANVARSKTVGICGESKQ